MNDCHEAMTKTIGLSVVEQRLLLTGNGDVRYRLKAPYRDGATRVVFEPLELISRLRAGRSPPGRHTGNYAFQSLTGVESWPWTKYGYSV